MSKPLRGSLLDDTRGLLTAFDRWRRAAEFVSEGIGHRPECGEHGRRAVLCLQRTDTGPLTKLIDGRKNTGRRHGSRAGLPRCALRTGVPAGPRLHGVASLGQATHLAASRRFRIPSRRLRPMSKPSASPGETSQDDDGASKYRPSDRFWPYLDVPEEPSDEELARLDPDVRKILHGDSAEGPFSVTLVFPSFDGVNYERAVELARASTEYLVTGVGPSLRHRARFLPSQALSLRTLFELVGPVESCEVLIDDRPVPYARELWLPLMWFLIR